MAEARERGGAEGLPRFVERELRELLTCGVVAHGFARVRCSGCLREILVACSCKGHLGTAEPTSTSTATRTVTPSRTFTETPTATPTTRCDSLPRSGCRAAPRAELRLKVAPGGDSLS